MIESVNQIIQDYLDAKMPLRELESWAVAHLQEAFDIQLLIDFIDITVVEIGEKVSTEQTLREGLQAWVDGDRRAVVAGATREGAS